MKRARAAGALAVLSAWLVAPALVSAQERQRLTPLDIPIIGEVSLREVGDPAPDFRLEDLQGRTFRFAKARVERVHLVVFWSIFCSACRAELPALQALYERYRDQGLEVAAIAVDGEPMKKGIRAFVARQEFTFPVLFDRIAADETFVTAESYGVSATPTFFLVDRSGTIAFAEAGRPSAESLEQAIRNTLGSP
jgi:peroxiredoxin